MPGLRRLRRGIAQADAQRTLPRLAKIERMASARVRGHKHVLTGGLGPLHGIDECNFLAGKNLRNRLGELVPARLAARKHSAYEHRIAKLKVLGVGLANKIEIAHDQTGLGAHRNGGQRMIARSDERLHRRGSSRIVLLRTGA